MNLEMQVALRAPELTSGHVTLKDLSLTQQTIPTTWKFEELSFLISFDCVWLISQSSIF